MKRAFANKVDTTAKPLIAYARDLGFGYAPINGTWDGDLYFGRTVIPVDWKTPGKGITPAQGKLIAADFPLRFISTPGQLDTLRAELMRPR